MKTKPIAAYLIGAIFFAIAASFPFQISFWYEHDLVQEFGSIWAKLTWLNLLVMSMLSYFGYQIMSANLNKVTPMILFSIIGFNNYVVGLDGELYTMLSTLLATATVGIALLAFSRTKLFHVLCDKNRQWWRAAPRKRVQVPIRVAIHQLQQEAWKSIDMSSTGMFLKAENDIALDHPKLKVGSHFPIYLEDTNSPIDVEIVRKTKSKNGRYTAGLGLKFINLKNHQRSILSQAMA